MKLKPVIIILGPTAVGKTGVSILFAKALDTEIISADSMQVYRHMDIGTAKPSSEELRKIPHHLINILSPDQSFSAGMFKEKATGVIDKLHSSNRIPLIVGGTGLYIRALTRGLFEGPTADWTLRESLHEEERSHGRGHLYKYLQTVDPEAADKINPNDSRRIVRALEVAVQGGNIISKLHAASTRPEPYDFVKIGLSRDRKELYRLIEERIDRMIEKGLLRETEGLLLMKPGKTAMQALGYKEMVMHLRGEIGMEEAIRMIKRRTKMYAKRQYTWFKKEPDITWVDITDIFEDQKIFEKIINDVEILKNLVYS